MKLTFLGAAREVTGSCYLLQINGSNLLIDCGMEQGPDVFENQELPVTPAELSCVLLTHAHIDHSGKLPMLYASGFQGPVYTTEATADLCGIMLRDSAHIQEFEAEWRNRRAKRSGDRPYIPLYTMEDAEGILSKFVSVAYDTEQSVLPGVTARFVDAGHLLGSASIVLTLEEKGEKTVLVFSGDIGNTDKPILRDPQYIEAADYVVMESTYGDRTHGPKPDYVSELTAVIQETFDRGGNLVIPSFAVGRTQELLYFLRQIKAEGRVHGHDGFTVYVDSPLANEATNVFGRNSLTCFDEETMALIRQGINPLWFDGLKVAVTSEDSRAINDIRESKIIISASGMCEAGRIRHHLKHNLWRADSTVLFVGYQARGTLGRSLLEGAEKVKLFGESIEVKARICTLEGISGHADSEGLLKWAGSFRTKPRKIFVVHGEEAVCEHFTGVLRERLSISAEAPYNGDRWDLTACVCEEAGPRTRVCREKPNAERESNVFRGLVEAGKRLLAVITQNRNASDDKLRKFTREVDALSRKWEKK